jgi:hypothetical protein
MGMFDVVKEYSSKAVENVKETLGLGDSAAKVGSEGKGKKKSALSALDEDIAQIQKTTMTTGFYKHPVIPSKAVTPADFYRRGKPQATEGNTRSTEYDMLPRLISDAGEEAPASIRVVGRKTEKSVTKDVDLIPPFTKFFLESVQEGSSERSQIVETFGDFYVFFFGERPPVYTFTGTLINADDINWAEDFAFYYESFLRGTKCVEVNARLIMTYGFRQIEAFMMSMNTSTNANMEKGVAVSFQVLVIDRKVMKLSRDFGILESNGKFNSDKSFLTTLTDGLSKNSEAWNQAKDTMDGKVPAATTSMPKTGDKGKSDQLKTLADKVPGGAGSILNNGRGGLKFIA